MNRELALEFVRVTEAAALACGRLLGRGDKNGADGLAVEAMRRLFDSELLKEPWSLAKELDEAPMLYIAEKVGNGNGPKVDIAVDPLEGTNLVLKGCPVQLLVWQQHPQDVCYMHPICIWRKSRWGLKQPESLI